MAKITQADIDHYLKTGEAPEGALELFRAHDPAYQIRNAMGYTDEAEAAPEAPPAPKAGGLLSTIKEGAQKTGRALGSAIDVLQGDGAELQDAYKANQKPSSNPYLRAFYDSIATNTAALPADYGWLDAIGANVDAILEQPRGAGYALVEQLPNAAVVLGGAAAGAKAGGLAGGGIGAAFGGVGAIPGAAVGSVLGGIAGMFAGNTALETGFKGQQAGADGELTAAERDATLKEGVIKGGVLTAVDAATFGASKFILGATTRAVEQATVRTLRDAGVDLTSKAALEAAQNNPAIVSAVRAAQDAAYQTSTRVAPKLGRVAATIGLETTGEGVGEYLGELAATGHADKADAVLEAFLGLGQSIAEAGIAGGMEARKRDSFIESSWGNLQQARDDVAAQGGDALAQAAAAQQAAADAINAGAVRVDTVKVEERKAKALKKALSTTFKSAEAAIATGKRLNLDSTYAVHKVADGQFTIIQRQQAEAPNTDALDHAQAALASLDPQAKAQDAAQQVLAAGGTEADANRAATDSLIGDMAQAPEISISSQAPAAVAAASEALEAAAHQAATSPQNDRPEPTEAQKEAGNYAKGHIKVQGLDISVENPRGSERSGKRPDGSEWRHEMSDHYGYIKRTTGADGEHVDVYVGDDQNAPFVYVVDQLNQQTKEFDEHKVMVGFRDKHAAIQAYKSNFDEDWQVGAVTAMGVDNFKEWLKTGDTTKPVGTDYRAQRRKLPEAMEGELHTAIARLTAAQQTLTAAKKNWGLTSDVARKAWGEHRENVEGAYKTVSQVRAYADEHGIDWEALETEVGGVPQLFPVIPPEVKTDTPTRVTMGRWPGVQSSVIEAPDQSGGNTEMVADQMSVKDGGPAVERPEPVTRSADQETDTLPRGWEHAEGVTFTGAVEAEVARLNDLGDGNEYRVHGASVIRRTKYPIEMAGGHQALGRRADGKMIYADENGVRYYKEGGVGISETVSLRPTREGMRVERKALKPEFMTADEAELEQTLADEAAGAAELAARAEAHEAGKTRRHRDDPPVELPESAYDEEGEGDLWEQAISRSQNAKTLGKDMANELLRVLKGLRGQDDTPERKAELKDAIARVVAVTSELDEARPNLKDHKAQQEQQAAEAGIALGARVKNKQGKGKGVVEKIDGNRVTFRQDNTNNFITLTADKLEVTQRAPTEADIEAEKTAAAARRDEHLAEHLRREREHVMSMPLTVAARLIETYNQHLADLDNHPRGFHVKDEEVARERQVVHDTLKVYRERMEAEGFAGDQLEKIMQRMPYQPLPIPGDTMPFGQGRATVLEASEKGVRIRKKGQEHYLSVSQYQANLERGREVEDEPFDEQPGVTPSPFEGLPNGIYGNPDRPLKFISGMSRPGDFTQVLAAGKHVGISINDLSNASIPKIAKALTDAPHSYLFVDTGAFSVFMANQRAQAKGDSTFEDVTEGEAGLDFEAILERYETLLRAIGEADPDGYAADRVLFVMPDIVGNQAGSLELVKRFADRIKGHSISAIVPLQGGKLSLTEAYEAMMVNLGRDPASDLSPVIGIPSNAAAVSDDEFLALLEKHGDRIMGVHILGAVSNKRLAPRLEQLRASRYDGNTSADANRLRALMSANTSRAEAMRKLLKGAALDAPEAAPAVKPVDAAAKPVVSENTVFTEDAAEKARALIRSKLGQLNTGVDPDLLQAGITLAGYHIEKGARTFAAYVEAMTADLGEMVRPYLKSWYLGVKFDPRASGFEGLSSAAEVEAYNLEEVRDERGTVRGDLPEALVEVAAEENGGTESGRGVGVDSAGTRKVGGRKGAGTDAAGVPSARGGRGGAKRADSAETGTEGQSGAVGAGGTGEAGSRVPEDAPRVTAIEGAPVGAPNIPAANFQITETTRLGQGGEVQKFNDNLAAIRTLKLIEAEQRRASPDEQAVLARYVGWGGLANAFPDPMSGEFKDKWAARGAELRELLDDAEYKAARASTRNAHYTSEVVVSAMWQAVERLGFKGGLVLESSMGTGNFLGLAPQGLGQHFIGVEYDSLTSRIAQALYPQATVLHSGFQKVPLADNAFALNIGNPPFGNESLRFQFKPELQGVSIHNQFFRAGMDALRPGGLQALVVSRYLMDAQDVSTRKELAIQAELVAAFRLPDTAFKENARTEVVTDILILKKRTPEQVELMREVIEAHLDPLLAKTERELASAGRGSAMVRHKELRESAAKGELPDWIKTGQVPDPLGGEAIKLNNYFVQRPQNIIGVLERSGSMQHGADVTVRLDDPGELGARLSALVARLPQGVQDFDAEVLAASEARFKSMSDALRIAVANDEPGHIKFDADGKLQRVIERETPEGDYEFARQEITPDSPWSDQLGLDSDGRWYRLEVELDEDGNTKKVLKADGTPSTRNLYKRSTFAQEADVPASLRLGKAAFARLGGLVKLRDLLNRQLTLEAADANPGLMEGNRTKLAAAYEAFVREHGPVNRPVNLRLAMTMPDGGLIAGAEVAYQPERTAKQAEKSGLEVQPEVATPAPIMRERVVPKYEPATHADSPSDALAITLSETGRVNMERIAELLGLDQATAIERLQEGEPLVYLDPETQLWETADAYLSGMVKRKLQAAKAAGAELNIAALEKVIPEDWSAENVSVQIGAAWVPANYYADFVQHLAGGNPSVSFSPLTNSFSLTMHGFDAPRAMQWSSEGASVDYIVTRLLNSQPVVVTSTDADGNTSIDRERTSLAGLKAREIVAEFGDWVFKDGERRGALVALFNELYNTRVVRQFNGQHLNLPGKVPDFILALRRHQLNAVWRGIYERFLLLDHAVGAGKTFAAIARAMERRRMGLSRKPMIVVPNHLVEQWAADVYRLYPGAKVLAAGKKDFEAKRRRRLFGKIATGDWDIVIVPHSSFGFIGISPETEGRYLEQELADAKAAIEAAWEQAKEDGTDTGRRKPFGVKEAERLAENIQARMDAISAGVRDRLLTFEQLGIDDLTVDESHEFKNLAYSSRLTGVRGMGDRAGSRKANDLYNKVRVLRENPNGSVVFLTGTPISNSAVEMFTILRYLAADSLKEMGMTHFDAFRAQFVEATAAFEPTESGRLKEVTRLGRTWSNMRALMDLYYQVTDAVSLDDIKRWYSEDNDGQPFPVPKIVGDKDRKLIAITPTPAQEELLRDVLNGFDSLDGMEDPDERNALRLRLMNVARATSLDVRAISTAKLMEADIPNAAHYKQSTEEGGKLAVVSQNIKRIYDQWTEDRGAQLVFLDRSVPKSKGDDKKIKEYDALLARRDAALAKGDENAFAALADELDAFDANEIAELREAQVNPWNAYQQIKDNLIAMGIPANEIRFIQEANTDEQKDALFEAVRGGKVRVLLGSTPRMGAGTNVQDRLVALHHVDVTWKPSDIEQREGRIIRQGNKLLQKYGPEFAVEILAYATERTVDAKMWDLNATKLRTINGIRKYDGAFSMEFEDEEAVGMAEMAALASGNPLLLERVKLESDIGNLELQERAHRRKLYAVQDQLEEARKAIRDNPALIELAKAREASALEKVRAIREHHERRTVTIEGTPYADLMSAHRAADDAVKLQQAEGETTRYSITIDGRKITNKDGINDAIASALGDNVAFEATLDGEAFYQRTAVARRLVSMLNAMKTEDEGTVVQLGELYGYRLEADLTLTSHLGTAYKFVTLTLMDGEQTVANASAPEIDAAENYQTNNLRPPVDRLVERVNQLAFDSVSERLSKAMANAERDLPGLEERVKDGFPKAAEMAEKRKRLAELVSQLEGKAAAPAAPEAPAEGDDAPMLQRRSGATRLLGRTVVRQLAVDTFGAEAVAERFVFASYAELPDAVKAVAVEQGATPLEVRAVHWQGKTYMVDSRFSSEKDAQAAMFHEHYVHFGLRAAYGRDLRFKLAQLLQGVGGLNGLRGIAHEQGIDLRAYEAGILDNPDVKQSMQPLIIMEELLAHLGETTGSLKRLLQEFVGLVRAFLRKHGFLGTARLGVSDLAAVLRTARKAAQANSVVQTGSGIRFSLSTETSAFSKWFGASKVVDAQGQPLRMFHGTNKSQGGDAFTQFDTYASNYGLMGMGGYFTADPAVASSYTSKGKGDAPTVYPVYLSIQNPVDMNAEADPAAWKQAFPGVEDFHEGGTSNESWYRAAEDLMADEGIPLYEGAERMQDGLRAMGHDGITHLGGGRRDSASVRHRVYIAFDPEQIKSATGNAGSFDPDSADIRFARAPKLTAAQAEKYRKLGLLPDEARGVAGTLHDLWNKDFRKALKEMGTRSQEGLFDGLIGAKRAEESLGITDPDKQGYVSMRMASGIADVMTAAMYYGAPMWKDGIIQFKAGTRGLLDVLGSLENGELTDWLAWVGGKRAELLKQQGRENNLTTQEINELLALAKGREKRFQDVYREYAQLNEAVLDLAEQAGLINPKSRKRWMSEYYIPFYRVADTFGVEHLPRTTSGFSHQSAAIRALRGGAIPTKNLLENLMTSWVKRIDSSMKNKALLELVDNLKGSPYLTDESLRFTKALVPRSEIAKQIKADRTMLVAAANFLGMAETASDMEVIHEMFKPENKGIEQMWALTAPTEPDIIRVQREGKNEYYRVHEESLLRSIKAMSGSPFNDPLTSMGRKFKRWLTTGVTAAPDFMARNFIRDAASSWLINKDGLKFGLDAIRGMGNALREDADYKQLMFSGGSFQGGYVHGTDPEATAQMIQRAIAKKGLTTKQQAQYMGSLILSPAKLAGALKTGWEHYRTLGDKVENANRLATYKAALKAGKSRRQAAYEAKDLMDYSLRGNFQALLWFTDVVPFLNARAQGLYKLGRAAKGERGKLIAKELAVKGAYLMAFTLALAALNDDDDRYKKLKDWDKDANWHFWIDDQQYRIPKPFELGLIFGTIPERMMRLGTGSQDWSDFGKALAHGLTGTLQFNPIPQVVAPLLDVQKNRDSFFDTPIETLADEGKLPQARYDSFTSPTMRALGEVTGPLLGLSPKQLEHMWNRYFGTLGTYALAVGDLMARDLYPETGDKPDLDLSDYAVLGSFFRGDKPRSTQYQTDVFDMIQEVEAVSRTIKAYLGEGRVDEARALRDANLDKLRYRKALGLARQQLGAVRKRMDAVATDPSLSGAEKRAQLDALQERSNQIAERFTKLAKDAF